MYTGHYFLSSLLSCAGSPPEKPPEVVELAYKSLDLGVSYYNDSNYPLAQLHFSKSLNIFRSIDHREGTASSCLNLAKIQLANENTGSAERYLTIAEAIISEAELDNLRDHLAITQSSLSLSKNNYDEAKRLLSSLIENKQDSPFRLAALQNSIRIAIAEKNTALAKELTAEFAASLTKSNQTNSTYQARLYRFQAELEDNINRNTEASIATDNNYKQALAIYRKYTHRPGIASTLYEWGNDLLAQNKLEDAKEKFLRALYIRQTIEDKAGSVKILESLNKTYSELNSTELSSQTEFWIDKINTAKFNQWEEFITAFNNFPSVNR